MPSPFQYCNSLVSYSRFHTREVKAGTLGIGGRNPFRIQSMTTTDTMNTMATVEQSIRMIEAGCELVRITAPSINEAENLAEIKKELRKRGYDTPLVADIHFTPNAAETAARIVEKVRINPGNYADKKKFEAIEYSEDTYRAELERIRERFTPLVKICKEYGTAMRIGTNHGSLSDRIMSRYGDSPLGMVESALEFVAICEENNYFDIVLSMKASNTRVMVQAYRLLVHRMMEAGRNYPLHLGVTEAGEGEDGRIKSAAGIGTLLEDGLGDTIRVSLTEDPEFEIPVAKVIAAKYSSYRKHNPIPEINGKLPYNPFEYDRKHSREVFNTGGGHPPVVLTDFSSGKEQLTEASLSPAGYHYSVPLDKWNITEQACDYLYAGSRIIDFETPGTLGIIYDYKTWKANKKSGRYPLFNGKEYFEAKEKSEDLNFVIADISLVRDPESFPLKKLKENVILVITTENRHGMAEQRRIFIELQQQKCRIPVIIRRDYNLPDEECLRLYASSDFGGLLLDGFGDGIWISTRGKFSPSVTNPLGFGILQATRTRISKTEYISCPSCGRTLFDLQETTAKIRKRTDHLKGVKIGIMGCIVNGPGEMADADYGYVGVGPGKISLYRGKEVMKRAIPAEQAVDELIRLIKEDGNWVEKEA